MVEARWRSQLLPGMLRDYLAQYEHQGQAFLRSLGAEGQFRLQAAWKRREMVSWAARAAQSLDQTARNYWARIEERIKAARADPRLDVQAKSERIGELKAQWNRWVQYKRRQAREIVAARARLEAQTDILAHSGLINLRRDRIMYFGGSPAPCPLCRQIQAGNPYTAQEARRIGGVAHPNCRDAWYGFSPPLVMHAGPGAERYTLARLGLPPACQQRLLGQWNVAEPVLAQARQKVRDGTVRLWTGQSRTPASGYAQERERELRQLMNPWARIPRYVQARARAEVAR